MAALATNDLEVLNEGYALVQESLDDSIKEWIATVFADENFVCAAFHYRPDSLWAVPAYKERLLMIVEKKAPDVFEKIYLNNCQPSRKKNISPFIYDLSQFSRH